MGGNSSSPFTRPPPPPTTTPTRDDAAPLIEYRSAGALRRVQRPTAMTVLGVVSICLGVIGILAHGGVLVRAVPTLLAWTAPPPPPPAWMPPDLPPPANLKPYRGFIETPNGIDPATRLRAIWGVRAKVDLPLDRRQMLYRLLAEHGRDIFITAAGAPPFDAQVSEAGQLPAGRDGLRTLGTHYFKTSSGAVLLDDTVGRFIPIDGSPPARVEIHDPRDRARPMPPTAIADVEEAIDQLRHEFGPQFNPVQARALADWLEARIHPPAPPIIPPGSKLLTGGTLEIRLDERTPIWFMADGRVITDTRGRDPATGRPITNAPAQQALAITRPMVWLVAADATLAAALAVALCACGILVFTRSPRAAQRHAQWAWATLIVVAIAAVPTVDILMSLAVELVYRRGLSAGTAYTTLAPAAALLLLLARAAYPAIVLVALTRMPVREHVAELGGTTSAISDAGRAAGRRRLEAMLGGRRGRIVRRAAVLIIAGTALLHALGAAQATHPPAGDAEAERPLISTRARVFVPAAALAAAALWLTVLRVGGRAAPVPRAAALAVTALFALALVVPLQSTPATAATPRGATIAPIGPAPPLRTEPPGAATTSPPSTTATTPATRRRAARPATVPVRTPNYDDVAARIAEAARAGDDRDARMRILNALRDEAEAGDLTLFVMLSDADELTRRHAVAVLAGNDAPLRHPPGAQELIDVARPQLWKILTRGHPPERASARRLLLRLGPAGARYVLSATATGAGLAPLPADFRPPTPNYAAVRAQLPAAMESVTRLTETAIAMRSAAAAGEDLSLYAMLADPDEAVRMSAAFLLTRSPRLTHPPASRPLIEAALPRVREMLAHNDDSTAFAAVTLIRSLGEPGLLETIGFIGGADPRLSRRATLLVRHRNGALPPAAMALLETKIPALLDTVLAAPESSDRLASLAVLEHFEGSAKLLAALRQRAAAWAEEAPADAAAAAVIRAGGGDWLVRAVDELCPPCAACDEIVLLLAGRGNVRMAERRSFRFRDTPDVDGARGHARLRDALSSGDPAIRRGAVAMVRQFTSPPGTRGGLREEDFVALLSAMPDRNEPYVQEAAGAMLARASADAFEAWTAQAVAITGAMTSTPTTTPTLPSSAATEAMWRLTAASRAPLSADWQKLGVAASHREVSDRFLRDQWAGSAETIWLKLTASEDGEARRALGRYLVAQPDRLPPSPTWRAVAQAAAEGRDATPARRALERESDARRAAAADLWPAAAGPSASRLADLLAAVAAPAAAIVLILSGATLLLALAMVVYRAPVTPTPAPPAAAPV